MKIESFRPLYSTVSTQVTFKNFMSWATNTGYFRWEHLWTDEGIARCIAIIAEKDRVYMEKQLADAVASKIRADVTKILEPIWSVQKKKVKPAVKPFRPIPTAPTAPTARPPNATRPCCVGCKKFQIHPNPPPHFTAEDMAHCCALCRLSDGKRHGDHCSRQKA